MIGESKPDGFYATCTPLHNGEYRVEVRKRHENGVINSTPEQLEERLYTSCRATTGSETAARKRAEDMLRQVRRAEANLNRPTFEVT